MDRGDCDHSDLSMGPEEYARLVEGVCVPCDKPADGRSEDGFASCSCCGVEWKIEGGKATIRAAIVIKERDDA